MYLAGDVPTGAVKSNFYIEQAEIVRAVGAVSERLYTPNSAREDTLRAVTRALRDRQTVVLSMPLDVQHAPFASNVPPLKLPPPPGRLHPDPRTVERLADALATRSARSFSAVAAPCFRMPSRRWSRSPIASARCWRHRCAVTGCFRKTLGRSASAADFLRRSPMI